MRKFTSLMLMLLCAVTTWGAIGYTFGTAPATTLTSGKYVLMAMCSHGTGPVYYNAAEGGNRLYRLDNGVTFNAGDEVNANYVWTLTLNDDGTFTLENVEDGKFFVKDGGKNQNFTGTETAVLAAEEHTINETQYFALHLANETDKANIGYIHANSPGGNPNLSYWNAYGDDGTCIKFQFYPVTEIEFSNGGAYSDGWKVADWAKPENTSTMEDILAAFHNSSIDTKYKNITADDVWVATREINISEAGTLAATITYSDGGKRLDLGGADVIDSEGNVVASDYHSGFAGGSTNSNTFVMDIPNAGTYTLRYIATFKFETNQSWGPVAITYNTNPYANKYFFIQEANQNSLVIDVKNFGTNQASIEKKDYSKNQIFQIYAAADSKYYLKTMSGHAIGTSGWDNNIQAGPTTSYMLTQVEGEEYYTIADAANHGFGTSNIAAGENIWTDHYPGKGGSANCYWNIIELTDDELALRSQYEELYSLIDENAMLLNSPLLSDEVKATISEKITAAQNANDAESIATAIASFSDMGDINNSMYPKSAEHFENGYAYTFISGRSATSYITYNAEHPDYLSSSTRSGYAIENEGPANQACQWAVYKSENGNYYMYNIAAGKFMGMSSAANGAIPFVATPVTSELTFKTSAVASHPIMFTSTTSNGNNDVVNISDGYEQGVINWDGGWNNTSDPGNVFMVEKVAAIEETVQSSIESAVNAYEAVLIKNDLETIIATANNIKENGFGEKVGQFVNSEKATFETAIATAQSVLDNLTSYADGKNAITTLQEAIDALTFNLPEDGKFYVMRSASTKDYCKDAYVLGHAAPKEHVDATWGNKTYDHRHLYFTKDLTIETAPIAIFQFNGNNGEYKVKNVHTNTFIKSFGNGAEHLGDEASAGTITLKSLRDGTGSVSVWKSGEADPMHAQEAFSTIVGWRAEPGNSSTWYVEEVETFAHVLNVTEVGYSTLMLGFDATIPAGVECYYATEAIDENGVLNLTKIDTGILPANTAVVVKLAEDSEAGDYKFTYSATAGTVVEGNLLSGTLYTKNIPATAAYVLSAPEGKVGLYKATLTDGAFQNNANKAYLVVDGADAAASYSFNFDWAGTTGIEGVVAEGAENGAIYDITGRRVKAITAPGIYIVNGRKVVK